ncbi:hypothetical protein [Nitrosospira sp. Nsp1]|uniref:hypothetical protein n=1 Tax=Nitrosospira sp. Nsp1 TaxID=136547 RepID=UPI00088AADDE|nr:hypothetical protein [Nitrosospira sp. Nsp1]SCX40426.1 hypothetical protein SAMN05720354_103107 [Nitrosospira sp. Nsp1]
MKWRGLIMDPCTGHVSHTKLWANVAYLTATGAFCVAAWQGTLTPDVWLIYLGVVGAHTAASKLIGLKYAAPVLSPSAPVSPDPETTPATGVN